MSSDEGARLVKLEEVRVQFCRDVGYLWWHERSNLGLYASLVSADLMQSFSYSLCGIAFNAFDVSSPYSANQMEWKNSTQWSKRTVSNGHLILCNTEHVHKIHKSDIVYLPKISQVALSVAAFLLKPIKTANLNPIEEISLSPSVSSTRCSIILGCFYFHGVRVL